MEELFSIDTEVDGTTVIVTASNIRLALSPKASAELADHMLNAMPVTVTFNPSGRGGHYVSNTAVPVVPAKKRKT